MRITATHLAQWSDQRNAQGMLPVLARRLISATARITALAMPGGDSVNAPGWDGVVETVEGSPWVPSGASYWELGTSKDSAAKAGRDFEKRLDSTSKADAAQATFVFVTSRRWPGKSAWQESMRSLNVWADVWVWDADDLEAWLETSPSTALWLGMQLGIAGYGIEAVEKRWEHWSNQSDPAITPTALFSGREDSKATLRNAIQQKKNLIPVVADSQSEAVTFVCGLLIEEGYSQRAACITSEEGWQFVDSNPGIELVVIADNRLANYRAPRDGMSLIVPMAFGDQNFNLKGIGARAAGEHAVELRRPKPDEFEKSLLELGIAASDASRLTRTLGRSWTVFRRWHAQNRPDMILSSAPTLAGAWNGASDGDKACIETIANSAYEKIENELLKLVALDDAPVVRIGSIWKAKAPLELLHLMAPRLTDALLDRFFQVATAVFQSPDPVLELEDEKRWMASVYGKVRDQSGVILEAMAESMAKLGYFSDSAGHLAVGNHVRSFVDQLLSNADEERWLSVSGFLRSFSEAAPDVFLSAIQKSLQQPERPVTRLITETQSSGAFGRCWHAELLWALELLAWYPTRLGRIASIFAEMSDVEVKGNWINTPFNSLVSLFRSWYPQTAASKEIRLRTIASLRERYPETTWNLLLALLPGHQDSASPNAKPRWRDDDAGAGDVVTDEEIRQFLLSIADVLIELAKGNARRIADLIPKIDHLDESFRDKVIALVASATDFLDEDRETVRNATRKFLSWENSFNQDGNKHDRYSADALRPLFDLLTPDDLVIRHAWIFSNGWVELPDGQEENYEEAEKTRAALRSLAVNEVYSTLGWYGIERLAMQCGDPRLVGWALARDSFDNGDLSVWICDWYINLQNAALPDSLTCGLLHAMPQDKFIDFLHKCLEQLEDKAEPGNAIASFVASAPQSMELWVIVENQPTEVRDHFWKIVRPLYYQMDKADLSFCIEKLLAAERPRTALEALGSRAGDVSGDLLAEMLKGIASGQEADVGLAQPWHIARVFEALSEADFSQSDLVGLEFLYYPVLSRDKYGAPHLMAEILSNPDTFIELICLRFRPRGAESESVSEDLRFAAGAARSLIDGGRGVPGRDQDGSIDREQFFSWVNRVRELARQNDREAATDYTVGAWLSDWPLNKGQEYWPDEVIAELLDQEDCEDIRRGFCTGVRNARGVTSRMPYDGGKQEREVAREFRRFASYWEESKPSLAAMIENLAKSYEHEARRHDEDGLWNQES